MKNLKELLAALAIIGVLALPVLYVYATHLNVRMDGAVRRVPDHRGDAQVIPLPQEIFGRRRSTSVSFGGAFDLGSIRVSFCGWKRDLV